MVLKIRPQGPAIPVSTGLFWFLCRKPPNPGNPSVPHKMGKLVAPHRAEPWWTDSPLLPPSPGNLSGCVAPTSAKTTRGRLTEHLPVVTHTMCRKIRLPWPWLRSGVAFPASCPGAEAEPGGTITGLLRRHGVKFEFHLCYRSYPG